MRIMLVQYYMFHFIVRLMIKMCIFFVMWKSEGEGFWRVQINLEKGRGWISYGVRLILILKTEEMRSEGECYHYVYVLCVVHFCPLLNIQYITLMMLWSFAKVMSDQPASSLFSLALQSSNYIILLLSLGLGCIYIYICYSFKPKRIH